jgi:tRNA-dihydrouridine synthase 1
MSIKNYLKSILNKDISSLFLAAPMVHQSELTFRLLCRRYNVSIAATPMLHSTIFAATPSYRAMEYQVHPDDRPLIAQLCGSEPDDVVNAAKQLHNCDIIDLNFGCPQAIARRVKYGAFLLSDISKMQSLVNALADSNNGNIPVSAKMRILSTTEETLNVAKSLVEAGAKMLTVHGRTREQNKQKSGPASWKAVRDVVDEFRNEDVVVISNGGIGNLSEAKECLNFTRAFGCMSAEGLLCNPSMFYEVEKDQCTFIKEFVETVLMQHNIGTKGVLHQYHCSFSEELLRILINMRQLELTLEYITLAKLHSNNYLKPVRSHLFKLCHSLLSNNTDVRTIFAKSRSLDEMEKAVITLVDRNLNYYNSIKLGNNSKRTDFIQETIEWVLIQSKREEEETNMRTAKYQVAALSALNLTSFYDEGKIEESWYLRHPRL